MNDSHSNMVTSSELDSCAESIIQIEKHADQLMKYGKELERKGPSALSQLSHRIENEADAGRYLTGQTGNFLKVLQDDIVCFLNIVVLRDACRPI